MGQACRRFPRRRIALRKISLCGSHSPSPQAAPNSGYRYPGNDRLCQRSLRAAVDDGFEPAGEHGRDIVVAASLNIKGELPQLQNQGVTFFILFRRGARASLSRRGDSGSEIDNLQLQGCRICRWSSKSLVAGHIGNDGAGKFLNLMVGQTVETDDDAYMFLSHGSLLD